MRRSVTKHFQPPRDVQERYCADAKPILDTRGHPMRSCEEGNAFLNPEATSESDALNSKARRKAMMYADRSLYVHLRESVHACMLER